MLKFFELREIFKINDVTFVTGAQLNIVATFVGALVKDRLNIRCNPNLVSPVGSLFRHGLLLGNNFTGIVFQTVIEAVLVEFDSDSGPFLQCHVNLAVFVDPDVRPAALIIFGGPVHDDPLSVRRPLISSEMMWRIQRVHEPSKTQSWRLWKQRLSQVLRRLKVLHILHEELSCCQVLHHLHLPSFVCGHDYHFVERKHGCRLGDLTNQVSL